MKLTVALLVIFIFGTPLVAQAQVSPQLAQSVRQRLKLRKLDYEARKKATMAYHERRKAAANRTKKQREEIEFRKQKARDNFVRTNKEFPVKSYRKFIEERDRRVGKLVRVRTDFQQFRRSMDKIIESSEYKIDKMEEYNLR